jgi:hypothetical protein
MGETKGPVAQGVGFKLNVIADAVCIHESVQREYGAKGQGPVLRRGRRSWVGRGGCYSGSVNWFNVVKDAREVPEASATTGYRPYSEKELV